MHNHKKHLHGGKSSREILNAGFIMENWGPQPGSRVADVGCGDGYLALAAALTVGSAGFVHGLDVHPESLESAEAEARSLGIDTVNFMAADVTEGIPLPDDSVDFVIMSNILHGFIENGELEPVMTATGRVLKEGGSLLVIEFKKAATPVGPPVEIRLKPMEVALALEPYGFSMTGWAKVGVYHHQTTLRLD